MLDNVKEKLLEALGRICQCFNRLFDELVKADLSDDIEPYEPRARPTHWQRRPEPKTKPHTLPVFPRKRVFHCRDRLPFVVMIVDEE